MFTFLYGTAMGIVADLLWVASPKSSNIRLGHALDGMHLVLVDLRVFIKSECLLVSEVQGIYAYICLNIFLEPTALALTTTRQGRR